MLSQKPSFQHNSAQQRVLLQQQQPNIMATGTNITGQPKDLSSSSSGSRTVITASQRQQSALASRVNMPSASAAAMRVAQVGSPNDVPTVPEGNLPVNTTQPSAALPLYVSPDPSFDSITEINVGQEILQIPQSFLGLSHEWTHVEELNNIPGYKDILNMLTAHGSGPMVIRVGGGSTDKQTQVAPQYVYEALRQVHQDTGAHFILGLNFEKGDIELAKQQFAAAHAIMPPESIITFEIGNEVSSTRLGWKPAPAAMDQV